jgi:IS5 family transposase
MQGFHHNHPASWESRAFIPHAKALYGRPFDGHTLKPVIHELTEWCGIEPERIFVDKGYRRHDYEHPHRVYRSGQNAA